MGSGLRDWSLHLFCRKIVTESQKQVMEKVVKMTLKLFEIMASKMLSKNENVDDHVESKVYSTYIQVYIWSVPVCTCTDIQSSL